MESRNAARCFRFMQFLTILACAVVLQTPGASSMDAIDYYKAEKDLISKLLEGYDPNIRPKIVINGTYKRDSFIVHLELQLYSLRRIDEIEETMTTSMIISLIWFDTKLSWDPAEHNNITEIYLKASDVWRPLWFVGNSVEKDTDSVASKEWVPIAYHYSGRALWQDRLPLHTACSVDTTYYPFDKQSCSVQLHWFDYEIDIMLFKDSEHLDYYEVNAMWELYNYTMNVQSTYPDFQVTYNFYRKPDHTIYNVLFPVMLIALLGPLVFLLPAESGERTGYIITVLLSVSVYMIIISDQLPRSSNPMSLLTYVLFGWYVLCALIVIVVVIASKIYAIHDSKPVSKTGRLFVRLVRCKSGKRNRRPQKENGTDETTVCVTNGHGNGVCLEDDDVTWATVGRAIDKAALIIFYVLKVSFILLFAVILNWHNL